MNTITTTAAAATTSDRYVEFDEEFQLWGIFNLNTGFCYSQHYSKEEANEVLKNS